MLESVSNLIQMTGRLHYSHTPEYGYRLVVEVCEQFQGFYRSLIPKTYRINGTRSHPHITVVRKNVPPDLTHWGAYDGEQIEFLYDPYVHTDGTYWWLNCFSTRLEDIAEQLGLRLVSHTEPPSGFRKVWHTTIANSKLSA